MKNPVEADSKTVGDRDGQVTSCQKDHGPRDRDREIRGQTDHCIVENWKDRRTLGKQTRATGAQETRESGERNKSESYCRKQTTSFLLTARANNQTRTRTDLVLPLELGPHGAEGLFAARRGLDVVHDVHVDVVEVDVGLLRGGAVLVHDRPEDVPGLRAAHLQQYQRKKAPHPKNANGKWKTKKSKGTRGT